MIRWHKFGCLVTLTLLIVLVARAAEADGAAVDLSSPESTIATFYRGYTTGNVTVIAATFLSPKKIEKTGLGVPIDYRIVAKKIIVQSPGVQPGDLEIITTGKERWPKGQMIEFVTSFFLRQMGNEWKITGYASEDLKP